MTPFSRKHRKSRLFTPKTAVSNLTHIHSFVTFDVLDEKGFTGRAPRPNDDSENAVFGYKDKYHTGVDYLTLKKPWEEG